MEQWNRFMEMLRAKDVLCTLSWEFERTPFTLCCYQLSSEKKTMTLIVQIWPKKKGFTLYYQGTTSDLMEKCLNELLHKLIVG